MAFKVLGPDRMRREESVDAEVKEKMNSQQRRRSRNKQ